MICLLIAVCLVIAIPMLGALGLILSQWPQPLPPASGLDFTQAIARTQDAAWVEGKVAMRDGFGLTVREIGTAGPLVLLIHGSGWNGQQFAGLAQTLSQRAQVLVPDLRGHGADPGTRGDVGYIGQMEDDLADLIAARVGPDQKVVLIGHSSGGGLVVRFAGGPYRELMDAAVLLAPFLKYDAPSARPEAGGWARPLVRRLIGLSILNAVGVRGLNGLTVVQLRMPQVVLDGPLGHTATTAYSYRLNTGYAPRSDYLGDVAALPAFLLIVGREDEAFVAEAYEPDMSQVTAKGQYLVVPGVKHLDIVDAPETEAAITAVLNDL